MNIRNVIAAASMAATGLLFMSQSGYAAIVCNSDGDCWHAHDIYTYPPGAGIEVHPDAWKWGPEAHFRWHEHEGRGFWGHGEWRTF